MAQRALEYQALLEDEPQEERDRMRGFEAYWPSTSAQELKEVSLQPEDATTLRLTYATGLARLELLYLFSAGLARVVGTKHKVRWSVKRPMRLWRKTIDDYPDEFARSDFRHCTDVYRTSVVVETLAQVVQMVELLEGLGRDAYNRAASLQYLGLGDTRAHFVVERIKNRFVEPCPGGYMDVLVSLRINGYVTEVQLHLARLLDLKGDTGRATSKWFRLFMREANEYDGDRADDGKMHGAGTYYPLSGGRYDGDFMDGKRHGKGTFYYSTGDRYEGEFVNGKKSGTGTYFYANGDRYKGSFGDDRMHGGGTYYYANGDRYEGEYNEGKRHGTGAYYDSDGVKQEGDWWRNKRVVVMSL